MTLLHTEDPVARTYDEHREAVLAMLSERFPRFPEHDRLDLYQDAWERLLRKQAGGEQIPSPGGYLIETVFHEALHRLSRNRTPAPVDPDSPELVELADDDADSTEEQVLVRDQARIARELIASLEPRQQAVFKLRWDLQLDPDEVRRALDLSRKQYLRLSEEGAATIARRVTELHDGTWSRRQRSLLTACLVGIATGEQRSEAQRRLATDPAVHALFLAANRAVGRAAAIIPLPATATDRSGALTRLADHAAAAKAQLSDLATGAKQHAAAISTRATDASPLVGARPGAAVTLVAGCIAVGSGAGYCIQQNANPLDALPHSGPKQGEAHATSPPGNALKPQLPSPPVVAPTAPAKPTNPLVIPRQPESQPAQTPAPTPPPPTSPAQEFDEPGSGFGAIQSSATRKPAPAPSSGGGEFSGP
ncbi:MAG: sigma-70 family RNA polymerase sigma factor [Solirubrobacteraceae bacterium]